MTLATRGKEGQKIPFPIFGTGEQTRSFVHIDDFTNGLMRVIETGEHLEIYHIGNDEEVTIAELARLVVAQFECEAELVPSEAPAGETPRRCPDITKVRALGYEPKISLAAGLPDVAKWYAANAHLKP
ncbi:MAG: NAD-dependent epimerase/dehydratase family protein [Deltaproteobacteria bacterium]|nr:NAD-dependent epimerase/dehydratase family protein [Deltaproteobacteria bacterium]